MSNTFRITINTDNAAFDPEPALELSRILREIADRLDLVGQPPSHYQTIYDINGNDCGRFALKPTETD